MSRVHKRCSKNFADMTGDMRQRASDEKNLYSPERRVHEFKTMFVRASDEGCDSAL